MSREHSAISERPDFMAALELLPPYTLEDVRKAYQAKARGAHPDAGGKAAEFIEIAEAYRRAVEYVEYRSSPREWIAARVERYVEQDEFVAELKSAGGSVDLEDADWRWRELGEFGQLGDRIVAIRLNSQADISTCLKYIIAKQHILEKLVLTDFGNSRVTDSELGLLSSFAKLRRLDLRNTAVSFRGLRILHDLKDLTTLNLGGTRISRWQRFRLGRRYPELRILMQAETALDALASPVALLAGGS